MKREFALLCLVFMAFASSTSIRREAPKPEFMVDFSGPELTIYQIASAVTGCPEEIIRGLHFAESTCGVNLNHPDPLDRGEFALHEDPAYHAERAAKWGEYNPDCPLQSAIIAGYIYMENLRIMGNERDAIASYKQGMRGVRENGRQEWYVDRVLNYRPIEVV